MDKTNNTQNIAGREAARLLGVNRQRISALLKAGKIKGRKRGYHWEINRASVEAYKAERDAKHKR